MKKWLGTFVIMISVTLGAVLASAQTINRFAIVNIVSIFQRLPKIESISKQLEQEFQGRAHNLQLMEENLEKKIQRLQLDGSKMNTSEHHKLEQEIILERKALANKAQEFETDKHDRQIEEQNKILSMIREGIKTVASGKYDVVFNADAIMYANQLDDLTEEVLNQVKLP
ncbi:MAG: OmpH family outer membrane protein [Candidatus Dasytiphilus stammeri]